MHSNQCLGPKKKTNVAFRAVGGEFDCGLGLGGPRQDKGRLSGRPKCLSSHRKIERLVACGERLFVSLPSRGMDFGDALLIA